MGKDYIEDFVKNTKQYADETDTDKQDEMQKGLYARWTAFADEEQQPRQIWIANDKSDNSVLHGH
jgi:hypothetical protein